jgi:aryl-alcohol dehydrogenase-like predicted oxidoreductase
VVDYVRLGSTGVEVSELSLGTWKFGPQGADGTEIVDQRAANLILDAAWQAGVNFFDTANVYGGGASEQYIGGWLADKDREDFVLSSKVFFALAGRQRVGLSRKIIMAEIEGTLRRLGSEYLDVYYIHGWHTPSPLEETLSALNDLVRAGKVHYLGVSNFTAWQFVLASQICQSNNWAPISVVQPRFNAVDHVPYTVDPDEMPLPDLFDACRYLGAAVCAYSPLAEGFLTGKYSQDSEGRTTIPHGSRGSLSNGYGRFPERWWKVLAEVRSIAKERNATPTQVAISWVMGQPDLTSVPIVGVTSETQLLETLAAADLSLRDEEHQRITMAGQIADLTPHAYTYV